jgi:diketogulonate reductase-like aldo/keto reductase
VIGIGTWRMGGEMTPDRAYDKEAILAIKTAVGLGMTHINTAEVYGDGHAEELVGEAIREFDRGALFITTKVKWTNLRYADVIEAAGRSLRRLGTNYVDLYLVHAPNSSVPIEETIKAMDYVAKNKLARFIGVSNFSVKQIEEAQQHAENKIAANEIEYNLLVRDSGGATKDVESRIIPYCQKNDIAVIAYKPLARGELAKPGIKLLDDLAKKYGKTQAQIAINWLISKPNIVTIPKATKTEHLKENSGAIGWKLSRKDTEMLDHDFPTVAR